MFIKLVKIKSSSLILLITILLIGAWFRFFNINWDSGTHMHPDERAIIMYALPIDFPKNLEEFLSPQSSLNPHFFAYGNLPLYFLKSASVAASYIDPLFATYEKINILGRFFSVIFDLFTIILVFKIGKRIFSETVGLASAFIYSLSVLPIQYSHFFTSDIMLTFFITLTLYLLLKFYSKPKITTAIFVGISFGLSLATKISAIPLLISIITATAADFFLIFSSAPHKPKHWLPHFPSFAKRLIKDGVVIFASTLIAFFIAQPYALIDLQEFISQNLLQSKMTHDPYVFPYTLQYVGKIPIIYELKNIFLWGLGPIISTLSLGGIIFLIFTFKKIEKSKKPLVLIVYIFSLLYFLTVAKFSVGWMRYLLPIYPTLAVSAGIFIVLFVNNYYAKIKSNIFKTIIGVVFGILIISWPISFMSVYSAPNTRISATKWILQNIPDGTTLAVEHWDDRVPMYANNYNFVEMTLYDQPDDNFKWNTLNNKLSQAEYIILASNRLYTPLQKLDDCNKFKRCYPLTKKYYQDLFSGKLGFKKVAEFNSYPTIPFTKIKLADDGADESFTVYDHPKILIFKKNSH